MELRFTRATLLPAYQRVSALIPSNGDPTLIFSFTATDCTLTLKDAQFEYEASFPHTTGAYVVPPTFGVSGKTLWSILRGISDETFNLEVDEDEAKLRVTSTTSEFTIPLLPAVVEPTSLGTSSLSVPATDLLNAFRKLQYAIGTESGRPYLMVLDVQDGRARACDGWKYHEISLNTPGLTFSILESGLVTLMRVLRLPHWEANGVTFHQNGHNYLFVSGQDILTLPMLNIVFPDLDAVLVRPLKTKIPALLRVNKEALLSSLKQVRLLTDKDSPSVEMYLTEGQMVLRTSRTNANAVSKVPVRWAASSRTAYFDVDSLLSFLSSYDRSGDMEIRFGTDTRESRGPIVIEGENSWQMLNQLKITNLQS